MRSATCRTARSSDTLMCSPANIASRRCGTAGLLRQLDQQPHRLVGDAVLGVVEVDALGLGRQPLAAARIGREQLAQVTIADLGVMALQRLPGLALAKRRNGHHCVSFEEVPVSLSVRPLPARSSPAPSLPARTYVSLHGLSQHGRAGTRSPGPSKCSVNPVNPGRGSCVSEWARLKTGACTKTGAGSGRHAARGMRAAAPGPAGTGLLWATAGHAPGSLSDGLPDNTDNRLAVPAPGHCRPSRWARCSW